MKINGIEIHAVNFEPEVGELERYAEFVDTRVNADVARIYVTLCDDGNVDINYVAHGAPFERIRRITGYLTGDLTSWNNAKQAEEKDRVKHL